MGHLMIMSTGTLVVSLMEKYIAYKNSYVKNIKFDAHNNNLSKIGHDTTGQDRP